jgi:hypothetical protein
MNSVPHHTIRGEWLTLLWQNDQAIARLDPLRADEPLRNLPAFNADHDTESLLALLRQLLPTPAAARALSVEAACAAMRDLGILLGSLKKHGIEPEEAVPPLRAVLPVLGTITNYPPRDTLLHYTIWNPADERMRTYTGTEDEKNLIRSVQMSIPPLEAALHHLMQLLDPAYGKDFQVLAKAVADNLEGLIAGVVYARRNVSTSYFAHEMRLYYDPIRLNGASYLGPGAVEMPVFVFDHLLWSSDCADAEYQAFKQGYLPYVRPVWRLVYEAYAGQPSLLTELQRELEAGTCPHPVAALRDALSIITRLKSFRMPHRRLADEAYAHGNGGERNQGSGGYAPDILLHIIQLMTTKTDAFVRALQKVDQPTGESVTK